MALKLRFILNGGLGNQIFQYLASLYIQEQILSEPHVYSSSDYIHKGYRNLDLLRLISIHKQFYPYTTPTLSNKISRKTSSCFALLQSGYSLLPTISSLGLIKTLYLSEDQFQSSSGKTSIENLLVFFQSNQKYINSASIEGYWQNPSPYIHRISDWSFLFESIIDFLPLRWKSVSYISVHIRRGDFLGSNSCGYEHFFAKFHPIQYLQHAFHLIPRELDSLPVIVVTDDPKWAEYNMNLLLKDRQYFINSSSDPLVDWALLTNSSFSILGNSTFSFTAALLNRKSNHMPYRVMMPQWINKNESAVSKGWISLPGTLLI